MFRYLYEKWLLREESYETIRKFKPAWAKCGPQSPQPAYIVRAGPRFRILEFNDPIWHVLIFDSINMLMNSLIYIIMIPLFVLLEIILDSMYAHFLVL